MTGDRALIERPSVRDVLARVSGDGVLTPGAEDAARAALVRIAGGQMPWYLRVLIGAGAWVGASFLLSAIVSLILLASGEQNDSAAIVLGAVFLVASIAFRHRVSSPFLTQLALVVSSTGQILLIGGVGAVGHSVLAGSIAAVISSIVLIAWFPDRVQRFSATLVICGAFVTLVVDWKIPNGTEAIALVIMMLTLWLWRFAPRARIEANAEIVEPIVYGLVITLFGLLLMHTIVTSIDLGELRWLRLGSISVVAFLIALAALAASIFIEHEVPLTRLDAVATFAGIAALGAITRTTPALVATILLLVLGFDRRARALIALGTVFFLVFTSAFYYDMHLTLLQKSGILMLSGAICLAAWAAVRPQPRPA